jgi:hypothetical protein
VDALLVGEDLDIVEGLLLGACDESDECATVRAHEVSSAQVTQMEVVADPKSSEYGPGMRAGRRSLVGQVTGACLLALLPLVSCGGGNTASPPVTAPISARANEAESASVTPVSGTAGATALVVVVPRGPDKPDTIGGWGGGLSREQVRRVVVANAGAVQACYEIEAQKDPALRGGVSIQWTIDAGGDVTDANLASSTLHSPRVEGCVLAQVRTWHFPSSDRAVTLTFPFVFGIAL